MSESLADAIRCAHCGITFAMDDYLNKLRRSDNMPFHCPNGHPNFFAKPKVRDFEQELKTVQAELVETKEKLTEAQIEIRRLKCEIMAKGL